MNKDVSKVLVTAEQITARCKELGAQIEKDYEGKKVVFVGLLKGSMPFMSELVKYIDIEGMELDYMKVSSYSGTKTSHNLKISLDLNRDIEGLDIVIVEDIVDTGFTLQSVTKLMKDKGANSVEICTLLNKEERREVDIHAKYVGFEVPDEFVIGFGLDFDEKYRQLPYVGVLKEECYK